MNTTTSSELAHVTVTGHRLEYYWTRPRVGGEPVLVFLHEGLGSARLWRDFPAQLAARTGLPGLVYSRYGYGGSDVLVSDADGARPITYLHREAQEALPELRAALGLDDVILIGHSDGGSISLLHASGADATGPSAVRGMMIMAPHVFVEDVTIAGIEEAKIVYDTTDLPARIGRHHANGDATFWGWNATWLTPAFRDWNIEDCLPGITAPVLVIQGADDQYGSQKQLDAIAAQVSGPAETLMIPECGHSPQRDQPEAVLEATAAFVVRLVQV
jgi:pimeloyl-ACP methyl ester carboxylesterase